MASERFSDWRNAARSRRGTPAGGVIGMGPVRQIALGLACAFAAWAIRAPLDPLLDNQAPYALFYVSVVLSVVWGGQIAGWVALISGGLAANWSFAGTSAGFQIEGTKLWGFVSFLLVAAFLLIVTDRLIASRRREEDLNRKLELLRGELQHRIKNFIAVAQAIAMQTGRSSTDFADFEAKFTTRLQALAGAQALLDDARHAWAGLGLLVERTLAPFQVDDRVAMVDAPDVRIGEDVAAGLALVLNELATNALKYGALSTAGGRVTISYDKQGDRARLTWRESGGPAVTAPSKGGFGTRLIKSALPKGLGSTSLDYGADGVTCVIDFDCTEASAR